MSSTSRTPRKAQYWCHAAVSSTRPTNKKNAEQNPRVYCSGISRESIQDCSYETSLFFIALSTVLPCTHLHVLSLRRDLEKERTVCLPFCCFTCLQGSTFIVRNWRGQVGWRPILVTRVFSLAFSVGIWILVIPEEFSQNGQRSSLRFLQSNSLPNRYVVGLQEVPHKGPTDQACSLSSDRMRR